MMTQTIVKSVKRMKQTANVAKAYDIPVTVKDMKDNDRKVKEFFAQFAKG